MKTAHILSAITIALSVASTQAAVTYSFVVDSSNSNLTAVDGNGDGHATPGIWTSSTTAGLAPLNSEMFGRGINAGNGDDSSDADFALYSTAMTTIAEGTYTLTSYVGAVANKRDGNVAIGLFETGTTITDYATIDGALGTFAGLTGVTTTPSVNTDQRGNTNDQFYEFTTTYTIAAGSAAIGKQVSFGTGALWNNNGGRSWWLDGDAINDEITLDFVAVPEPASAALLFGLSGMALILRRRR